MIKSLLSATAFLMLTLFVMAQTNPPVDMAGTMQSNGKIYVVLAVILTIFAGIIFYLVRLDRKITRLEKENQHNHL